MQDQMGLPRPHGGLVVVQANAERFPSRRAAGEATRTAKSGSVTRLPRDRRRLALTERARRYRWRPGGWTAIAIVLGYCSSGDHVAKSRVEFQPCRAAYDRRTSFVASERPFGGCCFQAITKRRYCSSALPIASRSPSRTDLLL
jgi:hypothetical protein